MMLWVLKLWGWLRDYWYIPLAVLAFVLGAVLFKRTGTPIEQTLAEIKAIQASTEVKKMKVELGAEVARKHVEEKYVEELKVLDEKQQARAKELRDDPAKLAKFLVRVGS